MALPPDPAATNLDAWGLKRMVTLQIRRWMSGASNPREMVFKQLVKFFFSGQDETIIG